MAKLLVTTEEITAKASAIEAKKEEMMDLKTQMYNKVNQLSSVFDSESGHDFEAKYPVVDSNAQRALERIMTHVTNLKQAAQEFETAEAENRATVGSLSDVTIS